MTRTVPEAMRLSILLTFLIAAAGCDPNPGGPSAPAPDAASGKGAAPAKRNSMNPGVLSKSTPELKKIMQRVGRGPDALNSALGKALKAEPPAWEAIQSQTKEYAQLAADMSKYEPAKGSKESWAKNTEAFASSAAELDTAARAKDKDAALAAHQQLSNSCSSCHREHRMAPGGGGPGGPGGGPGGFRGGPPGGGPPPDGPPPDGPPPGGGEPK